MQGLGAYMIIDHHLLLMGITLFFGLIMAGAVGANDVANAMGTSVGANVLTLRQAVVIAGIFEALGALLASGQVSQTLSHGIIDVTQFVSMPGLLVLGMIAALIAAGGWLVIATVFGWPVSTTHAIVGALIGFAAVCIGVEHVRWNVVVHIVLSWVLTPAIAALGAYLLFISVQKGILSAVKPYRAVLRYMPIYIFLVGMVVIWVTLSQGLKPIGLNFNLKSTFLISVTLSVLFSCIGLYWMKRILGKAQLDLETTLVNFKVLEQAFGVLAVFTACAMAFAHGSNDTANAIGPMATVYHLLAKGGQLHDAIHLPFGLVILGAVGVVLGLAIYGYRVIATVGERITELTPSRGFAAQLSTATTVVVCSGLGLPVSTTQILIGALLGVGLARGIASINLRVVKSILISWVITLPMSAILSIAAYYVLLWSFKSIDLSAHLF